MAINIAGFKTEWQKVMKSKKETLMIGDILSYLEIKEKKDEFASKFMNNYIYDKKVEYQNEDCKEWLSQFGEKAELTLDQKQNEIVNRFRNIVKDKQGKNSSVGVGRFDFDNLHYLFKNLGIVEKLPITQWEAGESLKYQAENLKLSIFEAVNNAEYKPAAKQDTEAS